MDILHKIYRIYIYIYIEGKDTCCFLGHHQMEVMKRLTYYSLTVVIVVVVAVVVVVP